MFHIISAKTGDKYFKQNLKRLIPNKKISRIVCTVSPKTEKCGILDPTTPPTQDPRMKMLQKISEVVTKLLVTKLLVTKKWPGGKQTKCGNTLSHLSGFPFASASCSSARGLPETKIDLDF